MGATQATWSSTFVSQTAISVTGHCTDYYLYASSCQVNYVCASLNRSSPTPSRHHITPLYHTTLCVRSGEREVVQDIQVIFLLKMFLEHNNNNNNATTQKQSRI